MIKTRLISSLEKCFPDQQIKDFSELSKLSVLKNETFSFQLIVTEDGIPEPARHRCLNTKIELSGELAKFATVRNVECIASAMPCYPGDHDDNFLGTEPGLFPDLLKPLRADGRLPIIKGHLSAFWITVELDGSIVGDEALSIRIIDAEGTVLSEDVLNVKIIGANLPEVDFKVTQWFHPDCLANYYHCKVFSSEWWRIVENFMKTAVKNGINMILTPVFTSPLDTAVGGERLTVQLVDVTVENGKYSFGYKNLDRWIKICDRVGVKYFEISHFFTQWGAAHAPKVMATVDGEYKKIFGWETDATGEEYPIFLRSFLKDFLDHMKARGDDKRCFFHISDEPNMKNIDQYTKSRNVVKDLLEGYTVMDALSNIEFYKNGLVTTPIPANNHIEPFLEAKVEGLWTYYCCTQAKEVSNRFFAMPSWRTRCIGTQFFKYNLAGFLQWGYNFYNTALSIETLDPYLDSTGGKYHFPSGDSYSVYPAPDGTAYESIRIVAFHEGLSDRRACELCASLIGKEKTVAILEKHLGNITFRNCPRSAAPLLAAREEINAAIDENTPEMTVDERKAIERAYLGKKATIKIDRPIGYVHKKGEKVLNYPINYGYLPEVIGGDGENIDVYLLGVNEIVDTYKGKIIAIVHRENDSEDKLVMAPVGMKFTEQEIADAVEFQEKYYKTYIELSKK